MAWHSSSPELLHQQDRCVLTEIQIQFSGTCWLLQKKQHQNMLESEAEFSTDFLSNSSLKLNDLVNYTLLLDAYIKLLLK